MKPPRNPNSRMAAAIAEELFRSGVTHACISPGSRSSALAIALGRIPRMHTLVVTDERSAAFFALGMARELDRPVALLCTSGTAAANYLPGIVEASLSEVPLVVLTADRPAELRDCGAPQTIDQVGLYGRSVRFAFDLSAPSDGEDLERFHRRVTCRAVAAARGTPRGPVHLNVPMREPLFDPDDEGADDGDNGTGEIPVPTTRVLSGRPTIDDAELALLAEKIGGAARGIVICGPRPAASAAAVASFARHLGWPILADPVSGLRFGGHDRTHVVDAYDVLLRDPRFARAHVPDAIVQLGTLPASRALQQLVEASPTGAHVVVASPGIWPDPLHHASDVVHADAGALLAALCARLAARSTGEGSAWTDSWLSASEHSRRALTDAVRGEAGWLEGKLFPILLDRLPDDSLVYLGNSMPIRDADTFLGTGPRTIRFAANRGANGIDGVTSAALGAAAVRSAPTVVVLGDLSFLHDLSALQIAARHRISALVLVVNNDGGGIFSFLPQATLPEFEPLFGTPHGLDLEPAVRLCGGSYARPESWEGLARELDRALAREGLRVVEIRGERSENRRLHRRVLEAALASTQGHGGQP